MSENQTRAAITDTLTRLTGAIVAQDVEALLPLYSESFTDQQGNGRDALPTYFGRLFSAGLLKSANIDTSALHIEVEGGRAVAAPVVYETAGGSASFQYELERTGDDTWLITASRQYQAPSEEEDQITEEQVAALAASPEILAKAGRLVDAHAMAWIRRINAPIERVWEMVSTIEGLNKWWVVPPSKFELKKGGAFNHHWNNTVVDFRKGEYIDFAENTGKYSGTGGMRFELRRIDDDTTLFTFLDTWGPEMTANGPGAARLDGEQARGPGTPWPGVAAGWHRMVDNLEYVLTGREPPHGFPELTAFYVSYLRDHYRLNAMVQRDTSK